MNKAYINLTLPNDWESLTNSELKHIYRLISIGYDLFEIKLMSALKFIGMKVIGADVLEYEDAVLEFSKEELHGIASAMNFIDELPRIPVRPRFFGRRRRSVMLNELDFETFLVLDNHLQGYISTDNPEHLAEISDILYPEKVSGKILRALRGLFRRKQDGKRTPTVIEIASLFWLSTVKTALARLYPFFLQPKNNDSQMSQTPRLTPLVASQAEAVDAQLRALTKGDITKEEAVRGMPYRRALTELNALAREADELKRKLKK